MKDLPVDRVHTLENFRDMYHFRDEDVLLCEAFANAQDVFLEDKIKNPKIEITLEKTGPDTGYINFHNNGTPMTEKQFQKYHEISGSAKVKGGGIGFAGVGAKVFLASKIGGEIFTITGKNNSDFLASRMLATKDNVQYEEITNISEIFGNVKYTHEYGTTYRVRVNNHGYKYFKEKLSNIVQFWWNYALLQKQFTVTVEGKEVKAYEPGEKFRKSFTWKKNKIQCYCWIARNEIVAENRHIVYSVHGKRITNETISQPINLKEGYFTRVFCIVDVSHLAKYIRTDKESFEGNGETNQTKHAAQKFFVEFLTEQGLLVRGDSKTQTNEIVNEFTKELDRLLKTKDFKDLNPFLSSRKRMVPLPDENGDFPISEVEGEEVSDGDGGGVGEGTDAGHGEGEAFVEDGDGGGVGEGTDAGHGEGTDAGHGEGEAFVEDSEGDEPGKHAEKKSKGIRIILTEEFPDEKEEAWVDLKQGAICINVLHPFYITMRESDRFGKFEKFNIHRILIESLIKFKNDEIKDDWDPKKTLDMYRDLLHKTWSG